MKKILILLILLPLSSFGAERWKITFVTGKAYIKSLEESSWKTCKPGQKVTDDSVIRTGSQSSITLERHGRLLSIDADSVFPLKSLTSTTKGRLQTSFDSTNRLLKKIMNKNSARKSEISGVRGKLVPGTEGDVPAWSDDLSEKDDDNTPGQLEKAGKCLESGDYDCVQTLLEKKISAYSDAEKDRASFMLGTSCFHLALYKKSLSYLETASRSSSLGENERRTARLKHALAQMFLGDPEEAARELEILVSENSETEQRKEALFALGNIYYLLGRDERALYWYKTFLIEYPEDELTPEVQKIRATIK